MNEEDLKKLLLSKAFRGKKRKKSKLTPHFPMGMEREYIRISRAYMNVLGEVIKTHQEDIKQAISARHDDADDNDNRTYTLHDIFSKIAEDFGVKITIFDLKSKLEKLSSSMGNMTTREWRRAVRETLGIDITEDYFRGSQYKHLLEEWTHNNVSMISGLPKETLGKMEDIVYDGWRNGKSIDNIMKNIMHTYDVDKNYAKFLATDQMGKLNSQLNRMQQKSVGVNRYVWSTAKDSRVRSGHRKLHGKVFSWDDPPIVDEKSGRRAHPGEDYRCRCIAIAYFDETELNIPLNAVNWEEIDRRTSAILNKNKKKTKRKTSER